MTVNEITRFLETLSPLALQESYDNAGLIAGNPKMEVTGILISLDLTPDVMEEAIASGCNLVGSHHPFIFSPLKKVIWDTPESAILSMALSNNVAVYALHTNLDNTLNGLNALLMNRLGIHSFRILRPLKDHLMKLVTFCPLDHAEKVREALFQAGAGHIGNYDCCSFNVNGEGTFRASGQASPFVGKKNELHAEPETRIEVIVPGFASQLVVRALHDHHPYEEVAYDLYPLANIYPAAGAGVIGDLTMPMLAREFLETVKDKLHAPVIKHTAFPETPVKTIALCSGSGSFLIRDAMAAGADIFITADLKYHDFFIPDSRMLLADIGHYESEQWVKEWVFAVLNEKFPNFAILISKINTNPVNYF
jgi:dinuclear metal center YbgI/SA1388 family protein